MTQCNLIEDLSENSSEKNDPSGSSITPNQEIKDNQEQIDSSTPNSFLDDLNKELALLTSCEARLQCVIDFMSTALAQTGSPHFKSFWLARTLCLQLFKEDLSPATRTALWSKYSDLSKEARRLKEVLDEQSAFAIEQIDIAIQALETSITEFEEQPKEPINGFPFHSKAIANTHSYYRQTQYSLDILNQHATRINGLRKELIKTDMRVRKKNQFFQRLSVAGDHIFPKRKELIKNISQQFCEDIDAFIAAHFNENHTNESIFALRNEIKMLQSIAKVLTLNAHAFTHTRMQLSACWDKLKLADKERKKELAQAKVAFKQNTDDVLSKIEEFNTAFKTGQLSTLDANHKLEEISTYMRRIELGRDDVKLLRTHLHQAQMQVMDKVKSEEQQRQSQEQERSRIKQQQLLDLQQEIATLIKAASDYDASHLITERDALFTKIQNSPLIKGEKKELERLLNPLRDLIESKHEEAILALSENDRQSLQQIKELLHQKQIRRQEIKNQVESLRKAGGLSGLDFDRAMNYTLQINEEKERLDKINQTIQDLEQKIKTISKRCS